MRKYLREDDLITKEFNPDQCKGPEIEDKAVEVMTPSYAHAVRTLRKNRDRVRKIDRDFDRAEVVKSINKVERREFPVGYLRSVGLDEAFGGTSEYATVNFKGYEFAFVGYYTYTRNATTEHIDLYINDRKYAEGKYRWVGRPWQRFDFESAVIDALNTALKTIRSEELKNVVTELKGKIKGIDRLSDIKTLKEAVKDRVYKKAEKKSVTLPVVTDKDAKKVYEAIKRSHKLGQLVEAVTRAYPNGITEEQFTKILKSQKSIIDKKISRE